MLSFINYFIVNLAIIISATLFLYFIFLYMATSHHRTKLTFKTQSSLVPSSLSMQILLGCLLGLIAFVLSLNKVPLIHYGVSVDMRYVLIYFTLFFGSKIMGLSTTIVLIGLKSLQYVLATSSTTQEHLNNIWLTLLVFVMSLALSHKKMETWRANILFLFAFISIRFMSFPFYFYPFFTFEKIIPFILYCLVFSIIFGTTAFLINHATSVSESIHIYRSAAIYDSLTKLYNRESFHFFLDYAATTALEEQLKFSIVIIDIDDFKHINDKFGHVIGDKALIHVANLLKNLSMENNEKNQYICRIGGDEFAIIHQASCQQTLSFLEAFQKKLSQSPLTFDNKKIPLTLSIGVSHYSISNLNKQEFNIEKAFELADQALYEAKRQGKNQIIISSSK